MEKLDQIPNGKDRLPSTNFQGRTVSFREGIRLCGGYTESIAIMLTALTND